MTDRCPLCDARWSPIPEEWVGTSVGLRANDRACECGVITEDGEIVQWPQWFCPDGFLHVDFGESVIGVYHFHTVQCLVCGFERIKTGACSNNTSACFCGAARNGTKVIRWPHDHPEGFLAVDTGEGS